MVCAFVAFGTFMGHPYVPKLKGHLCDIFGAKIDWMIIG